MSKRIFLLAVIAFISDQITKSVITTYLELNQSIKIINNFFNIHYVNNYGASFGILENSKILLIILSIIAIILLIRYINIFKKNVFNMLGFGFLLGGILGNLSDRVLFGCVRDFLDFKLFGYNFPIFNFADIYICFGVLVLLISIIKGEDQNGSNCKRFNKRKNR